MFRSQPQKRSTPRTPGLFHNNQYRVHGVGRVCVCVCVWGEVCSVPRPVI